MTGSADRGALRVVPPVEQPSPFPPTLPTLVESLIGRADEVDRARALLGGNTRLLTITGTGGVGKTRLAIEVAHRVASDFGRAVVYVPLTSVADPDLVVTAVCTAAGLDTAGDRPASEVAAEGLGGGRVLLVLDNLEHVLAAVPDVVRLLEACPLLHVLVTSRVATRACGEVELDLAPLAIPPPRVHSAAQLARTDSVELLVREVRRFDPGFEIGPENARVIADLCRRLEGLPLAIELAAARLRLLAPAELVELLGRRLDVLRSTLRDVPTHQRTLRATIDWSYRLLDAEDQHVLRSLAVFAGGFTVDAVAQVTGLDTVDVLDRLEQLVAHHLVHVMPGPGDGRRFSLLDTIQEFAGEQLAVRGEQAAVRDAHAAWCAGVVAAAADQLIGPDQVAALERLDGELDNVRAALRWLTTSEVDDRALNLAALLWRYWWMRGQLTEGRRWLDQALASYDGPPSAAQATALHASGYLAVEQSDSALAESLLEQALQMRIALDDELGIAECWNSLGASARSRGDLDTAEALHLKALDVFRQNAEQRKVAVSLNSLAAIAYYRGDPAGAARHWEEAASVVRQLGDLRSLGVLLANLGSASHAMGDNERALAVQEEALAMARQLNDAPGIAHGLGNLGGALVSLGQTERARDLLGEALELVTAIGDRHSQAIVLQTLGRCAKTGGDPVAAGPHWIDALSIFVELGFTPGIAGVLESIAELAVATGRCESAVELFAAAAAIRDRDGSAPEGDDGAIERDRAVAESSVGSAVADELRRGAAAWTYDDAAAAAARFVSELPSLPTVRGPVLLPAAAERLGLTARELEIVGHLVNRRTDKEIAADLFISTRTVTTHVSAVLRKLGVASRREVGAAVERLGLTT